MGRTIKLLLYYLIYQFATQGVFTCGYMVYHHTTQLPNLTDPSGVTLLLMSQLIGTLALVVHLLAWKYVRLNRQTLAYYNSGSVLAVSILFIIGMGGAKRQKGLIDPAVVFRSAGYQAETGRSARGCLGTLPEHFVR